MSGSSDEFSGRLGLIFATIGSDRHGQHLAIPEDGRGERRGLIPGPLADLPVPMVHPLVIAEFAMGKRSRTGTVGTFRIFNGPKFAWMGLWTAWISTAIGFYYAVVTGWCINYFQTALRGSSIRTWTPRRCGTAYRPPARWSCSRHSPWSSRWPRYGRGRRRSRRSM